MGFNSGFKGLTMYSCAAVFENNNQLVCSDFDVRESVHRDTTMKITNKMHYIDYLLSKSALHFYGVVSAHHQEHLTVFTVSGRVHPSCCRLAAGSNLGESYHML